MRSCEQRRCLAAEGTFVKASAFCLPLFGSGSTGLGKKEQRGQPKAKRKIILDTYNTVQNVNNLLDQRGLITWENLNARSISAARLYDHPTSEELFENTKVNLSITLTIKGYDLGRKYSSWWTRSGLWFAEYKNHWIWIVVSFFGGVVGALLVNWMSG